MWVDSHCHLDAAEFGAQAGQERAAAAALGVLHCVLPAVTPANFDTVRRLAHQGSDSYCLGIHPLYVAQASEGDLALLEAALTQWHGDLRLVAVGEIGLDYWVPELASGPLCEKQDYFFQRQLQLARRFALPVVLHVRRSADRVLKYLRAAQLPSPGGIAHAFNGSTVQAEAFLRLGFKLGFGGALTFPRATHLRRLAQTLPMDALVLETDAPDMAPEWLYRTAEQRRQGQPQARNAPAQLPAIGAVLAELRGVPTHTVARCTTHNVCQALPRVQQLLR